jgi:hypothetical protein
MFVFGNNIANYSYFSRNNRFDDDSDNYNIYSLKNDTLSNVFLNIIINSFGYGAIGLLIYGLLYLLKRSVIKIKNY